MTSAARSLANVVKIANNRTGYFDPKIIKQVCNCLDNGGVIALPTDTIYGLAAKVDNNDALERIYQIKGRDRTKPLAICLSSLDDIDSVAETSQVGRRILSSILPGPVTVLLQRTPSLNPRLNPGVNTIGIRIPNHDLVQLICRTVGPLALTSANRSGQTSPIDVEEFEDMWPELDCVINSGLSQTLAPDCEHRLARLGSTVIDLTEKNVFKIVREGCALNRIVCILNRYGYKQKS